MSSIVLMSAAAAHVPTTKADLTLKELSALAPGRYVLSVKATPATGPPLVRTTAFDIR